MGLGLPWRGGRHHAPFGIKGLEPVQSLGQDLLAFAEGEPDLGAGRLLVVVEDRGRDGDDAARTQVWFAFCKRPEVLTEALDRLKTFLT